MTGSEHATHGGTYGTALVLPPLFTGVAAAGPGAVFAQACALAGPETAGTLVHADDGRDLAFAVVLVPAEPLRTARRAFLVCMGALADAIGSLAPPEKAIRFGWPDVVRFNGAILGGGRLAWPRDCAEDAVPDWLVFGATLIVSKRHAGDPGLTPDSTSIEEEGFPVEDRGSFMKCSAQFLMRAFAIWGEDGFPPLADAYLSRLSGDAAPCAITETGDCITGARTLLLRPALEAVAWCDPETGSPRL
ncbi:biotin/lipoate--protein ligase family protein [Methylobacterium planeticum]|uniref:BPL/LPL catalytic domain-containing protein n=1 Tax=Methylobacterium planeticum TaxID=2615211 RepID=A0A6N6MJV8_9HYPH|nr:biotin/lipoate--protein ligase family protein [Methylobacterium planeticum]KAB1070831.1 hypothetical protein F6X51_21110 [Methylobacterium planeticum]